MLVEVRVSLQRQRLGAGAGLGLTDMPLPHVGPGLGPSPEQTPPVRHAAAGPPEEEDRVVGRPGGVRDLPVAGEAGYRDPVPEHPWSIVVGHDGVFKATLLTLFDLPLDRFWMWSMDLCGITVVELRAGRPVLRTHNLTAHLAAMADAQAVAESEERASGGAL